MLIVETIAVSTMVCNDLVMPSLLRLPGFGARAGGDLTRLLLNIRRAAILAVLMLGYLYFHVAGEAYALVSIGLISFAAVAQFGPALLVGMYWRGGTRAGALGGLLGGFAVWVYTLMLPSVAKSGWIPAGFVEHGPFGIELLAPERLFGLVGLDNLTHSLFWSLLGQPRALRRPVAAARAFGPRGEPGAALRRCVRARAVGGRGGAGLLARPRPARRPDGAGDPPARRRPGPAAVRGARARDRRGRGRSSWSRTRAWSIASSGSSPAPWAAPRPGSWSPR